MALELGMDDAWIEKELEDFRIVAEKYLIKPQHF
jgi:hypothetical protein